jgi:hypothetical protein
MHENGNTRVDLTHPDGPNETIHFP